MTRRAVVAAAAAAAAAAVGAAGDPRVRATSTPGLPVPVGLQNQERHAQEVERAAKTRRLNLCIAKALIDKYWVSKRKYERARRRKTEQSK